MLPAKVARIGKAFRLFLEPQELARTPDELGFTGIRDLGRQELNCDIFRTDKTGNRWPAVHRFDAAQL
jgi:hypothetical protein